MEFRHAYDTFNFISTISTDTLATDTMIYKEDLRLIIPEFEQPCNLPDTFEVGKKRLTNLDEIGIDTLTR